MPPLGWPTESNPFGNKESLPKFQEEIDYLRTQTTPQVNVRVNLRGSPKFLEDLKHCKDLAGLYTWAAEYNIELRRYSRLAFRQLYESGQKSKDMARALGDSALNNPDNLDFLLHKQAQRILSSDDVDDVAQWFQQTLSLGQWSEAQISVVINFVEHISIVSSDEYVKCSLAASVLDGLESSTILAVKDVKYSKFGILLKAVTRGTFTGISQDLGFRLIKALEPSQSVRLSKIISLFLQKGIETEASMQKNGGKESHFVDAIPKSFEILWTLPRRTSCAVVLKTSEALVKHTACLPESNIPLLRLLDQWWSWIRHSDIVGSLDQGADRRQLERLLNGRPLVIIATYLRHLEDFAIAHFILRRVLRIHLEGSDRNQALDLFKAICRNEKVSPFVSMMRAAHTFTEISERTTQRVFRLLQMLQRASSIADIIVGLRSVNIRISERVIIHTIKNGLHWKHPRSENIFSVFRELPLEKCPELAERMIGNLRRDPFEALKCYVLRHPSTRIPSCREPLNTIKARKQLLERMALTYANARHLNSRMAFKYVSKCYLAHMRDGLGYPGPGLVLALTRAGLIRPLADCKWVSTERLRWILKLIRMFEGSDVAEQVDRLVYTWRGQVVEEIQADYHRRKRARYGVKEPPMSFRIRSEWNRSQGMLFRILEPLGRRAGVRSTRFDAEVPLFRRFEI